MMKEKIQMSESMGVGLLLAVTGGFMDAYSYICRDHVFANAQTGNILLFGVCLSEKNMQMALRYLLPVLAFTAGIVISDMVKHRLKSSQFLHWRQGAVLLEICILGMVGFIPKECNLPANCLTSLACGIQVESFRSIRGYGAATTMCIGNLRSATQSFGECIRTKDRELLRKGLIYAGLIGFFVVGAVACNWIIGILAEKAILSCCMILVVVFGLMFI